MIDYNLIEKYFTTFISFDWGNMTLSFVLTLFSAALSWLVVKAVINLFTI